jgi:hypothetical protein
MPAAATPLPGDGVEALAESIRVAVRERQHLRATAADAERLEGNRLEIVRLQRLLSEALIARYLPAAA